MDEIMKLGIVGLDTSHCTAFTQLINSGQGPYKISGFKVVGAYPGGSTQFLLSRQRVSGFTQQISSEFHIPIFESIPELVREVDALLLLSGDGRQHLEQFRQIAMGKPVFIDKPLSCSGQEAREILALANLSGTPLVSCSSLRFAKGIRELVTAANHEELLLAEVYGPGPIYPDYPGLFWYGIHSVEILYVLLGSGCLSVRCLASPNMHLIIGEWVGGRSGIVRMTRYDQNWFGCNIHTSKGIIHAIAEEHPPYYYLLLEKIAEFFQTRQPFVDLQETLEIIDFIETAHRSITKGGEIV